MSSSSSNISSSSSGLRQRGNGRRRGMPPFCRCGKASIIRTSRTEKNPGRLFHCCPSGSEDGHLFRWTDECMVEDIVDLNEIVDKLKGEVKALEERVEASAIEFTNLEVETKTSEAVVSSYRQKIATMNGNLVCIEEEMEAMKAKIHIYEKQVQECTSDIRSLKNIIICGFVLIGIVIYSYLL